MSATPSHRHGHCRQRGFRQLRIELLEARHLLSAGQWVGIQLHTDVPEDGAFLRAEAEGLEDILATGDSYTVSGSQPLVVEAPGVLANDENITAASYRAELVAPPSHGAVDFRDDGSFTYAPTFGFLGVDQFSYQVRQDEQVSSAATVRIVVPVQRDIHFELFADASLTTAGIIGSYFDTNLRSYAAFDDWRISHTVAGTRIDSTIDFQDLSWGDRAELGLTGGSDENWENFSVQWDGFVRINQDGVRLRTRSDDGSRMWIDIDRDGNFASTGPELIDNGWGMGQAATMGPPSVELAAGVYPIRLQYEEGFGGNIIQLLEAYPPTVRVAYVIPSNREPQPDAVANLQRIIELYQGWFADQMDRNGFGSLTFRAETMADGETAQIHVVHTAETDAQFRTDLWQQVGQSVTEAGIPLWSDGEIWLLVPEAHVQTEDGALEGGVALGAGIGSGTGAGVAMIGAGGLAYTHPDDLIDDAPYAGQIIEALGPYPLVQDVSFPWFEGATISSVASSWLGAGLHELTHALGMPHDFRNDSNFHGNLEGNGLRGFRGALYPGLYAEDDMYLSHGQALALATNPYFQTLVEDRDNTRPEVVILTQGTPDPFFGLLQIRFTATDDTGLAAALLLRNGEQVGEMPLSGQSVDTFFATPFYTSGSNDSFEVIVYDIHGNRTNVSINLQPQVGDGAAPLPFFQLSTSTPRIHQTLTLDASGSSDPDGDDAQLSVEWDLDGDNQFDTAPTTVKTLETAFTATGTGLIRARLTDATGNQSLSAPIPIRVINPWHHADNQFDIDDNGTIEPLDLLLLVDHLNRNYETPLLPEPPSVVTKYLDVNDDGYCTTLDALLVLTDLNRATAKLGESEGPDSAVQAWVAPNHQHPVSPAASTADSSEDWRVTRAEKAQFGDDDWSPDSPGRIRDDLRALKIEHASRVKTLNDRISLDRKVFGSVDDLIWDVSLLFR
jgi:hypothetical protein